jgi:hypothetical protein
MSENDASNSILGSVKDSLGIIGYDVFDKQLIMHINSVFADLNQMGVGPSSGFSIADGSSQWSAFTEDDMLLNNVKSYMFLRVKMLFDPPTNSIVKDSYEKQINEWAFRLNVYCEDKSVSPNDGGQTP